MFELDYIKELAKVLDENSLTEMSIEDGEKLLVLKREKEIVTAAASAAPVITASIPAQAPAAQAPEAFVCTPVEVKKGKAIKSPMVGTFYRSPAADADPFVEVGSSIESGKVVCIIEAMKLMNEIESEFAGKVTEICVEDGQTVEFGQVLMYVE